jgi:tetratricopeptide (TPR) repeat protein
MEFRSKKVLFTALLLWGFAFGLYAKSLTFEFINFDDYIILLAHPQRYNEHSLVSSLKEIFFYAFPREEPLILRDITWAIDSYLFGFENPAGYHLGNVLFNSFNVVLLFFLMMRMGWPYAGALPMALTFAVLPVHVEPVCWVMGRKDVLVTFFMLWGLINHTAYMETPDKKKQRVFYITGILITLLAMLSKINALTFFAVLAAYHLFYPYLKGDCLPDVPLNFSHVIKKIVPGFLPHFLISIMVFFWYKGIIGDWGVLDREVDSFSVMHIKNLLTFTPLVLAMYVKLIFIPRGHSLHYEWPSIYEPLSGFHLIIGGGISLVTILIFIHLLLKRKDLSFYWIAFFLLMIPYLNIMYIGIWAANRYIYFSCFFLIALAVQWIAGQMSGWKKSVRYMLFLGWAGFMALSSLQTWQYQDAWRDDYSLWIYETRFLNNPSMLAYASLARAYVNKAGNEMDPLKKMDLLNQAEVSVKQGVDKFERSHIQKTTPHLLTLYVIWGLISELRGDPFEKQLEHYTTAYELSPRKPDVLRKMAEIYFRMASEAQDPRRQAVLAEESLMFFQKYLDVLPADTPLTLSNLTLLEKEYCVQFPFLDDRISPLIIRLKENHKIR